MFGQCVFFSSRRRHTRSLCDWSSDVCSSDLAKPSRTFHICALFRASWPRSVGGMAKERPRSPRVRLFVALDLPERVRAGIVAWGREALADPALRPVAPESLHITLAFLGYLAEKEIPRLGEIVEMSGAPAPSIELGDPAPRPERSRPRLFALPAESPDTIALQAEPVAKTNVARGCKHQTAPVL